MVHESPSSQLGADPATQPVVGSAPVAVGAQASTPLQKVLSEQAVSTGAFSHLSAVSSHESVVQENPSSQSGAGPAAQPVTGSAPDTLGAHASTPLQ
jgi:hypothetical protein